MITVIIIIVLALIFDFINGFHDTANAIATAVSTRALDLRKAIILAACLNFAGAALFTGVAETIAKDVVDLNVVANGAEIIIAALVSSIIWNLVTWYFGIPNSSSHALIGSMLGAALADGGASAIKGKGVLTIIESLITSPVIAIIAGYLMFSLIKALCRNMNAYRANHGFRKVQIITAALQAFSHGSNDAQKSMGIITLALFNAGYISKMAIPLWVQLLCATSMALGTSVGGWRIIKTVGTKIMKLKPVNGVAADLASSIVIQIATYLHLPVSTTHVIASSIMGVGAAERIKCVKWSTAKTMVCAWFITIPITICISAGVFVVINIFI